MSALSIFLVPYYHAYRRELERPYCLNYTNSSGELASTRFTYNRKGLNDMAFYQQILGGRSSRNTHVFDKAGRMVRKERVYNDGETSLELFSYDAAGRLSSESFESSKGPQGTAAYEYDDAGNAVRMLCSGYKGWLQAEIRFSFGPDGRRLDGELAAADGPYGSIRYSYSPEGSLLTETWELRGGWTQTFQYVYEQGFAEA